MTTIKTYTITDRHGRTHVRRSASDYVAVSVRGDVVRWHRSHAAAERAAGSGYVMDVAQARAKTSCVVCGDTGKVGDRSAVTGVVSWSACWRCGGK